MGATGIKTTQTFEEIFKDVFKYNQHRKHIKKYVEICVPGRYRDSDAVEQSEIFIAYKETDKKTCCYVMKLSRYKDGEVIYRIETERVGPYCLTHCPEDVSRHLTPINDIPEDYRGYMEDFRKRQNINH